MKLLDLKFWQKEDLVISIFKGLMLSYMLTLSYSASSQTRSEKSTYMLMKDIIYKDNTISNSVRTLVNGKLMAKKMTVTDTANYFNSIRNRKLALHKRTQNQRLSELVSEALHKDNSQLNNILSKPQVQSIMDRIPDEHDFLTNLIPKEIELVNKSNSNIPNHSFSSHIKIGKSEYLIYHKKFNDPLDSYEELIIYTIKKNSDYDIQKVLLLSIS